MFVAPAFGENLSTDGLTESNVYMGDIFRWGEALIQVSQPRSPCYKLNYHFDISDIAQLMQNTGKVGWLYSVIAPGKVSADAPLELVSRVSDVTVQEAAAIAWHMPFDDDQISPFTLRCRVIEKLDADDAKAPTERQDRRFFPPVVGKITPGSVGLIRRYQRRIRHPAQMPDAA